MRVVSLPRLHRLAKEYNSKPGQHSIDGFLAYVAVMERRPFTPDEIAKVIAEYPHTSAKQLARDMERSVVSLYRVVTKYGLRKSTRRHKTVSGNQRHTDALEVAAQ